MPGRFTIERSVEPKDREAFDTFVLERLPTVDEATEFLQAKGYRIHRSCVYGYMAALKVKAASETSASLIEAVMGKTDTGDVQAANRRLIVTAVQEALLAGAAEGQLQLADVYKAARTMKSVADTERVELAIREEERRIAREKQEAAVAVGEQAAKGGASATDVVATIKQALGFGGTEAQRHKGTEGGKA
jgi:hypothetical protein